LTFLEAEIGGSGGVPTSVNGPEDVAISPNGTSLVVASGAGNALNVFTRTAGTGLLTFFESKIDGTGGVDGLANATEVAISPDGLNVYASANGDSALAVFTRTLASGALNFVEAEFNNINGVLGLGSANKVLVSPDGAHVYASGVGSDAVAVFSRGANGVLTYVTHAAHNAGGGPALNNPSGLAMAPNGGQLYVTASASDAVTTFTRSAGDGTLAYFIHHTNTPRTVGLEQAISLELSPTGNTLYVSSMAENAIAIYQRDAATGVITFTQSYVDSGGFQLITGARAVTVSPDGLNFYIVSATDNAILAVTRHQTTGASLGIIGQLIDGSAGVDGMDSPAGVEASPDNKNVYVVTGGNDPADPEDAVTVFTRSPANGTLTFTATIKDGQVGANALNGANAIALNASGSSLYVAAKGDSAVTLFSRDVGTGLLTFVQAAVDGAGGITSLGGANDVVVSPDGLHLYATSATDDAVTVFSRQLPVGQLTYVEHETNGLDNPTEVAVTPNGRYVMVTSQNNDSLVVYERDAATGGLTLLEMITDEADPPAVNGLDQAAALLVSDDGQHLYMTGMGDDAVVAFKIGALSRLFVPIVQR
jgi:6-phosphogluconolactonase (cycloisomerase 2 family)